MDSIAHDPNPATPDNGFATADEMAAWEQRPIAPEDVRSHWCAACGEWGAPGINLEAAGSRYYCVNPPACLRRQPARWPR